MNGPGRYITALIPTDCGNLLTNKQWARTDSLGRFRLVGEGSRLMFSCVGYLPATKTELAGQQNKVPIPLSSVSSRSFEVAGRGKHLRYPAVKVV